MPARVPLNQSPVFFLWQDWALGAMYTKITIALTFMGPDWWLKRQDTQFFGMVKDKTLIQAAINNYFVQVLFYTMVAQEKMNSYLIHIP